MAGGGTDAPIALALAFRAVDASLLDMPELAQKECVPCKGGVPPLKGDALASLARQLDNWQVINDHLEREYKFENFRQALEFTNKVGELAEKQNHHPDIYLTWGKVKLTLWTHKIDGLTESDFVFAAKVNQLK
jgi:4a-hydroxytetrahydrobiopterin dehydratase